MTKTKIIIDTDIGDDIDDAFAIAYAMNSPEVEVVGITTVFKNAYKRAQICYALLESLNRSVPVYAGADAPLKRGFIDRDNDRFDDNGLLIPCQYSDEMSVFNIDTKNAVDFIIEEVLRYPGEITLVPIGPLTNIALAIQKKPEIIDKIQKIVLMGGYFECSNPEWNILCDPEAANIVFSSGADLTVVGLDVTLQCKLKGQNLEDFRKMSSSACSLIETMMDQWFEHYHFECPVLHDPLTIGTLVSNEFVKFEESYGFIDLDEEYYGRTRLASKEAKRASKLMRAVSVDHQAYLRNFMERVFQ